MQLPHFLSRFAPCHPSAAERAPALRRWFTRGSLAALALTAASCLRPPDPSTVAAQNAAASGADPGQSASNVKSEAYEWKSVAIYGGGFVTGLVYSPVKAGILYARTDVGGVYRYDPQGKSWIPLTDFLSPEQGNYMGIESFAADPVKADRVYLASGMYTQDWAENGAFLRSDDRGETWKVFPVSFKMGGNELSRSNGERLAVDPNRPSVLYFGSRRNGLWKSENEAETWKKVESFPVPPDTAKGLGNVFVAFDASSGKQGEETPRIYVASQTDGLIYHSTDAGKSWKPVAGQPKTEFLPRRAAVAADGTLYVTYALGDSPYALRDGAVYRYEPKTQKWADITPLKPSKEDTFGYGGVSLDRSNPGTLVVSTMDRWTKGAEVFRSKDRGKTWEKVMSTSARDSGGVAHVYHHREELGAPQWMGDIKVDPFEPNNAMVIEGAGVWATENLTAVDDDKQVKWSFHSKNIEEIVARDLISPPVGPPLISVQMDTCGFVHDDLEESPKKGNFTNPMCASAEDIDYAGLKPEVIVRVGSYPWDKSQDPRGAISMDSGSTWEQFGSEPEGSQGMGAVALSADGKTIIWAPRGAFAALSRDKGKTWTKITGLPEPANTPDWAPWFLQLAADRVNPEKFYAFDAPSGTVYVSTDGGKSFEATTRSQQAVPEYELQFASIEPVPGQEGHIWLTTKATLVQSTDSGKTFKKMSSVEAAHAVGFGKAAPGKTYPTIYISGTVEGVTGFFRSTDEAETFIRINDDKHQFGGSAVVTGDPRVYGRVYVATGGRGILYGEPASGK